MYKPLYWYHGNITFPDQEVEQVIKELERLGEELIKREDAISSYYLKVHSRPDKIWQPKYEEIVEEITDSIGIQKTCLLYTSPSPRDRTRSRMPSSA